MCCFLAATPAIAQPAVRDSLAARLPGLRISLLTCGPGEEEVYEAFGHTALRVVDSGAQPPFNDLVYNYGMFSYGKDFELQFMRGRLPYYVASYDFAEFMKEYADYGRSVQEQVLNVSDSAAEEIQAFLEQNCLPQNRYYKYDFFFDNCATRIRDIFPRTLGKSFTFGNTLKKGEDLTFRDITNRYFYKRHWERVGVNILLGSRIDKVMSNMDIMFLPDYLRDGVAGAALGGRPISAKPALLLDGNHLSPPGINWPMVLTCSLFLLLLAGTLVPGLGWLGRTVRILLLILSGLLGVIILVMWFATDHKACSDNFNLLWALPTNLMLLISHKRGRSKYALLAMVLAGMSFVVHLLHIQELVPEFVPLLLALLVTYGRIYRQSKLEQK